MTARITELPDGPSDDTGLTPRQQAILRVIRESVDSRGYPPSVREIGEGVGLTSPSSVAHQLATLERLGYLRRDPHRPRALMVADPTSLLDDVAGPGANEAPSPVLRAGAGADLVVLDEQFGVRDVLVRGEWVGDGVSAA